MASPLPLEDDTSGEDEASTCAKPDCLFLSSGRSTCISSYCGKNRGPYDVCAYTWLCMLSSRMEILSGALQVYKSAPKSQIPSLFKPFRFSTIYPFLSAYISVNREEINRCQINRWLAVSVKNPTHRSCISPNRRFSSVFSLLVLFQ